MTPGQLDELNLEDYWMCAEAMERIEAAERLKAMQAASAPYFKNSDRDKLVHKLERVSDPDRHQAKALTHEDMARLLNG